MSPTGKAKLRALFLCSQNRLRSPTAEMVFADWPGIECNSAGTHRGADNPLSAELVEWAQLIFCMEKQHQRKLLSGFRPQLKTARVVCLGIPDDYRFMQAELVALLQKKVGPYLRCGHATVDKDGRTLKCRICALGQDRPFVDDRSEVLQSVATRWVRSPTATDDMHRGT